MKMLVGGRGGVVVQFCVCVRWALKNRRGQGGGHKIWLENYGPDNMIRAGSLC